MLMKNIAKILLSGLLKLTLFWAAVTAAMIGLAGSPDSLKSALSNSGVYDNIVDSALEATNKPEEAKTEDEKARGVSLDQAQIKAAAQAALPPDMLQSSTEQALDGIYRWLNGEVATPDFRIDLTEAKARFISATGAEAEKHVASLPVCTAAQLREIEPDTDAFGLTCRPATMSAATARQEFESKLASNEDFLKDPVITADSIGKGKDGLSIFQKSEGAPESFQRLRSIPLIFLGVSLILGIGVFFLSASRRAGVKSLAVTLLGTGIFLLLTTWLTSFAFSRLIQPTGAIGKSIDNNLQGSILSVLGSLGDAFSRKALVFALTYSLVGLAALLALKFIWKNQAVPAVVEDNKPVEVPKPEAKTAKK